MLRTITQPTDKNLNQLHEWIKHLVCEVWCNAEKKISCENKLDGGFKPLYQKYTWLKRDVDLIYKKCILLRKFEKENIRIAFETNNEIENLCNNSKVPIELSTLPAIVEKLMKPFFESLYKTLLERGLAPITKMEYYKKIQKLNNFVNCPCCGYMPFEGVFSKNREDLDHFFPKAHYPFAAINFNNLAPLCGKCNSDNKEDNSPIKRKDGSSQKSFYPFQTTKTDIEIKIDLSKDFINTIQDYLVNQNKTPINPTQIKINLIGKLQEQVDSWNVLFNIENRYFDRTQSFTFSVLKKLHKKRLRLNSYKLAIDELINEIDDDLYIHEHFLQIPLLEALRKQI